MTGIFFRKCVRNLAAGLLAGLFLATGVGWGAVALAADAEHHHHAEDGGGHLAAMQRVKAHIPEEFRLMDRTPVTPSAQSLTQGKALYLKHCVVCHGQHGKGDGPAAAGLNLRPANFLDLAHSAVYAPGEKFWLIGNGAAETGMPGFAAQIEAVDRWHLVNYILSLQEASRKARGKLPPTPAD